MLCIGFFSYVAQVISFVPCPWFPTHPLNLNFKQYIALILFAFSFDPLLCLRSINLELIASFLLLAKCSYVVKVKQPHGSLNFLERRWLFSGIPCFFIIVSSFCVDSVKFDVEAGAAVSKLRRTSGFGHLLL